MQRLTKTIVIGMGVLILTGCADKAKQIDYSQQSITIYTSAPNEQSFYQSYGNNILQQFAGLDIQLHVNESGETPQVSELESIQPDLLMLHYPHYVHLRNEGYLTPLDTKGNNDLKELDPSQYAPIIVNMLSDHSGTLYGLAPNVYVDGLFYNKDLFEAHGVEHLQDGMSWEEVLKIAQLFPEPYSGIEDAGITPANVLLDIASTNHLTFIDQDYQVVVNGEQWKQVVEQVVSLYQHTKVSSRSGELFKQGEAAIFPTFISWSKELENAEFDWGFVGMPTHPTYRDINHSIIVDQVIAIPNSSSNRKLSGQILSMLMSEEVSTTYSTGLKQHTISTLKSKMNQYDELDLSNIWQQQNYQKGYWMPADIEEEIIALLYDTVDAQLQLVIDGVITWQQCMENINTQLTLILSSQR